MNNPPHPPIEQATLVNVNLGERAYDIVIGGGLIERTGELMKPLLQRPRTVVVTDNNVANHYLDNLSTSFDTEGIDHQAIVLDPGEATKDFAHFEELAKLLLDTELERSDIIVALGGGVIGDLVGFVASVFRRGIRFVQLPTTLLAQVDSAVGGKTGINTPHGKNLVGSFHQPSLVVADWCTLDTLPARELLAGYAEVVKYGLLGDAAFFSWLEANGSAVIEGDSEALGAAIARSCKAKALIVAADERESDRRALLNLGHTFAHAIEAEAGYDTTVLHGEAVALGMVLAFSLSARLGLCDELEVERVSSHLTAVGLPATPQALGVEDLEPRRLLERMRQDKKVSGGKPSFVLVRGIGEAFINSNVDPEALTATLEAAWATSAVTRL